MSIQVMDYVWDNSQATGMVRLVLLALADKSDEKGDCYPSITYLARRCKASPRTVQLCIRELERLKEIQVFESAGTKTGHGNTNLYRVTLPVEQHFPVTDGVTLKPRAATVKKVRRLSESLKTKDVQPVTPVQPVARHDVQPITPHDVQPVADESSVYTSVYTSDSVASATGGVVDDSSKPNPASGKSASATKRKPRKEKSSAKKEKPPAKPHKRNLMFDAVAEHIFGIDPASVTGTGGRIAPISNWLEGKIDRVKGEGRDMGFISSPAKPEHVVRFAQDYHRKKPGITIPMDFVRFVEAWRAWASAINAKPSPVVRVEPEETPAEAEARRAELLREIKTTKPPEFLQRKEAV